MYIKEMCPSCKGVGTLPSGADPGTGQVDCPNCEDGYIRKEIESTELTDILDKCADILDKCDDILEEVQSP